MTSSRRYNETQGILTTPLLPTSNTTQTRKRSGASSSLALAADNAEKLLLRNPASVVETSAPNGNSNAAGQMPETENRTYY